MLADLVPGLVAALGFGASNVFGKIALPRQQPANTAKISL